ncbi:C39 family peptidase [Candidatus Roizmanbacteria bacterium]|nr:C39 family peptidase [Candidatus Roizmanbacteria bacterium]
MYKRILLVLAFAVILIIVISKAVSTKPVDNLLSISPSPTQAPTPTPTMILEQPPISKILGNDYHIFQTFNNCGPAALSMALSYYGINESQQVLGQALRPYQVPNGDNDDKSVTLEELAEKSKEYGFTPYHRPNGNIETIKLFISYDIPIISRTLLKTNEDIGHYRIIKGYDQSTMQIIQDDSLQGKNLSYPYEDFSSLWKQFNYEYLVLVPSDKVLIAEQVLGEDADEKVAWSKALKNAENELTQNPTDIYARFNLSVALYNIGEYQRSVEEFEKVENLLPFRTLWYQIEPIQSYYELGNYDRVFEITNKILNTYNRAFSELYIIRGNIYKNQGNLEFAKQEFEKAVFYNINLNSAQDSLNSLSM